MRDAGGHVDALDTIEKFSLCKDFVMFSLKYPPGDPAFLVLADPRLKWAVYAIAMPRAPAW